MEKLKHHMKKLLLGLIFVAVGYSANAQFEINPYAGWTFGGTTSYSYQGYRLKIDAAASYGLAVDYTIPGEMMQVELSYNHYTSDIRQDGGVNDIVDPTKINVNYIQAGVLSPFYVSDKFQPFGIFTLGASQFSTPDIASDDYWRFAFTMGLGMKYFFSDVIGIRIQSKVYFPVYFAGAGMGCSIGTNGSGCGGGVGFGSEIVQLDITGGLVFRIN